MKAKFLLPFILLSSASAAERLTTVNTNVIPMLKRSSAEEVRSWLGVNQISTYTNTAYMTVDTVSALASLVRSDNMPQVVQTKGFYAAGDRGGAVYLWRSTSPTGQTNIFTIAAVGGGYWCEEDSLRLRYNVVKAGAIGKNISFDNTPVFQAVFDAAAQQQVGSDYTVRGDEPLIYIPSGVYRFYGPLYYIAPNRGHANIIIEGDGPSVTWLWHSFTSGALLNLRNVNFFLRKFKITSSITAVEYGRDGIYTYDCDYGNVYDMAFANLARAIILQNGSMNYNIFSGLQFSGCLYDFLPIGAQGTTVLGAHTTGGKAIWYGYSVGCRWIGAAEGKVGTTFAPATIVIPSGSNSDFDVTYTEANKWVAILGHSVTNRATATIDGSNVRLVFDEQHMFYNNESVTIQAEQAVPQDIQDYLVGARTLTSASMTNNYALLTPGGTITSDLTGYTFLVIGKTGNTAGVLNTRIRSSFAGNVYAQDPTAQYFAAVNKVNDLVLEGEGADSVMVTTNTGNLMINGKAFYKSSNTFPIGQGDRNKMLVPENIFPDPTFRSGLAWVKGASQKLFGGELVATNYFGQPALLFYPSAKPTGNYYPQVYHDFQPIRPMPELVGRRLAIAAEIIELNHPIFQPTAFTINDAGLGYTNGLATLNHLGRTIQVDLTTGSLGEITGVNWYFGAFATNVIDTPITVVQGAVTSGTVTPTAFDNRSYYNMRYAGRGVVVALRRAGENANYPSLSGVGSGEMIQDPITGHYKRFGLGNPSVPLESISGLRISFSDSTLRTNTTTGCEAYLITKIYVLLDPYYRHNLDSTVFIDRVRQHAMTMSAFSSAARLGASWPGAEELNIAKIFAGPEGGVTTMRVQRDNGTIATIPGFRGVTTTTPSNPVPGDSFISNSVYYLYNGTSWLPFQPSP